MAESLQQPVVSIACVTYNHENYIRNAIDGFLMQKVDFPIEIIIHDDASTDETPAIIEEYTARYPGLIVPLLQHENQYSQGIKPYATFVLPRCRGKYIANCEGDDYWTDPLKLQKQVDFLEAHLDHAACFHRVYRLVQATGEIKIWKPASQMHKSFYTLNDVLRPNFIATASIMFRSGLVSELPEWFYNVPYGDWPLIVLFAEHGKIGFIDQAMSTYRVHAGGVWSGATESTHDEDAMRVFDALRKHLGPEYENLIKRGVSDHFLAQASVSAAGGHLTKAKDYYLVSIAECPLGPGIRILDRLVLLVRLYAPSLYRTLKNLHVCLYKARTRSECARELE